MVHQVVVRAVLSATFTILAGLAAVAVAQPPTGTGHGAGMMGGGGMMGAGSSMMGGPLFENYCSVCHKPDGSGGVKLGNVTSPDLRAPALEQMYHNNDALLRRAILDGKNETGEQLVVRI